jgi:hypothetical protein
MSTRANKPMNRPTAFAAETVRAFSSALLLLGLIGDRRAH